jgi:hypothetical protein
MTSINETALEAAHVVYERFGQSGDLMTARTSDARLSAIITAYLSASLPADAGLVKRAIAESAKRHPVPPSADDLSINATNWTDGALLAIVSNTLTTLSADLAAVKGERDDAELDKVKNQLRDARSTGKEMTGILSDLADTLTPNDELYDRVFTAIGRPNHVGWIWAREIREERDFDAEREFYLTNARRAIGDAESTSASLLKENARLKAALVVKDAALANCDRWLSGRDAYIVQKGLWQDFVASRPGSPAARRARTTGGENG